jgi:predicted RND superfamily exporter protein
MSFRQTSAWIMLVTHVVVYGGYFAVVAAAVAHGGRAEDLARLLFGVIVAVIVIQIALHVVAAAFAPRDAQRPKDERERWIEARSNGVGYFVLASGAVAVAAASLLGVGGFLAANGLLLSLVLAEISRSGSQVLQFARGV